MLELIRTSSANAEFQELVRALDQDLAIKDGSDHAFYAQFNKIDMIRHAIVAYEDGSAVGCGAMKDHPLGAMEIKRMFVPPENRGKGIASAVLAGLETWAKELGYEKCVLETGKRQTEALALYKRQGYSIIPNYGQYVGMDNSVCFEKML